MQAKPSLFIRFNSRPPAERRRAPLLERLLARAVFCRREDGWREHAYGFLTSEPLPGLAAAALAGAMERGSASPAGTWVYFASPVHHTAGMSSVSLSAGALLRLEQGEALSLALDFNRSFGGRSFDEKGLRLVAAASRLYLMFSSPVRAETHDPKDAVQGDLWDFQPGGADGAYLRGLMSEIEMWLFDHPLNRERLAHGAPAITGLWLWGGGPSLASLPEIRGWTAGEDSFFAAFSSPDVTQRAVGAGHGVVVLNACPGTPAWDEAESRWLRPTLARLRSGALDRLELSSGTWLFGVDARWRFRIFRKTLPWWEQLR